MTNFLGKPSTSGIRWVARIMGTLLGLLLLVVFLDAGSNLFPATLRDYLGYFGSLLIILGFVVGWFKDLVASLLVLGGVALVAVILLLSPGGEVPWPWPILIVPAIPGFLFLYVYFASKKKIVLQRSAQSLESAGRRFESSQARHPFPAYLFS